MSRLKSDEFKRKLEQYQQGSLTPEEEEQFENELEKLDEYQNFLETEMKIEVTKNEYDPNLEKRILKRSQLFAYLRIGLSTLISVLLILPTLNLFTSVYYNAGGESSKMNVLQEITETVIPITNPNVELENPQKTRSFLKAKYSIDLYKRIGKERTFIASDNITLVLNHATRERRNVPTMMSANPPLDQKATITRLSKLNEEIVVELFIVFNEPQESNQVDTLANKYDMDILWRAVKTDDNEHEDERFIGYPENFHLLREKGATSAEEEFKSSLAFLSKHEKLARSISNNKIHSAKEKLNYIKKNGISIVGLSVTGPSQEILSFIKEQDENISNVYIGGEKLWNWQTEEK